MLFVPAQRMPLLSSAGRITKRIQDMPAPTRSAKVSSRGSTASAGCTGLKPPSRSEESVCWLRLSTTSLAPTCQHGSILLARLT